MLLYRLSFFVFSILTSTWHVCIYSAIAIWPGACQVLPLNSSLFIINIVEISQKEQKMPQWPHYLRRVKCNCVPHCSTPLAFYNHHRSTVQAKKKSFVTFFNYLLNEVWFFACMGHFSKIPCPSKTFLLPICLLCACKERERVFPFFSKASCTVHGFA